MTAEYNRSKKKIQEHKKNFLRMFIVVLMIAAYSQSPLFTSNQNQYFLHGMADAGMGSLDKDWLAATIEPTPLFTILVKWTFQYLKSEGWFYIYFAVLAGIYFQSLLGILDELYDIRSSKLKFLAAAALLAIFHSAGFRLFLTTFASEEWAFLMDGGFAGQRLLGLVFQPSVFGALLVLSLYLFIIKKPFLAAITAAITADIHPTYLLTAALLVGGYLYTVYHEEKKIKKPIWIGLIALIVVLPIMFFIYTNFLWGNETTEAYRILTEIRLPHHAVIREWFNITSIIKMIIIVIGLVLAKKQPRLFIPLLFVSILTFTLSVIQYVIESDFLALIFPWRPSTLLVPVCSAMIYGKIVHIFDKKIRDPGIRKAAATMCTLLCVILAAVGIIRMVLLNKENEHTPQSDLFAWVKRTSTDTDKYLIPIGMETFRTATLRPAYIDYFSIPYSDSAVVEWYHRVLAAKKFYDGDCNELMYLTNDEGLTYVITERKKLQPDCECLDLEYQDENYLAYRINPYLFNMQ